MKSDEACTGSLVMGTITIYKDDIEESESSEVKYWAIFKRTGGDPFLFRELFEAVAS